MARQYVFYKDDAGIRALLQSNEMQELVKQYALGYAGDDNIRPFVGFDRAKVLIYRSKKDDSKNH